METTNNGDMNMNVLQRKHDVRDMKMDDNGNGFAYLNGNVDTNHRDDRKPAEIEGVLPASMFSQVFTCCLAGITFGFVLEKGRVFEPIIIQDQMTFHRNVMLKMFLGAIAASQFSFALLSLIPSTSSRVALTRFTFMKRIGEKSVASAAVGGSLLGAGMAISGACPGQILIQIGHGIPNSGITFFGGCCGALLYGITESYVSERTRPTKSYKVKKLDDVLALPFVVSVMPVTVLLVAAIYALEVIAPWKTELYTPYNSNATSLLTLNAWPPYLSGSLVGFLQIPMVLVMNKPLGSSSSYCTISSRVFPAKMLQVISPYLYKARSGMANWWQVIYLSCAVGGAYYSAYLSDSIATAPGTSALASFTGGMVMLYGSRMAGGCTCGHGLSGTGMLSLISFVAVPFMFVGGVSTAVTLSAING
ncbi:thiosulfate transporter TsuA-like [Apostichopus japonicus]|uniref:thiosulfate transporter TsuA-like n=1 Tax=Stichopus japonicus TaxID=307972 RepID=UPI003AB83846